MFPRRFYIKICTLAVAVTFISVCFVFYNAWYLVLSDQANRRSSLETSFTGLNLSNGLPNQKEQYDEHSYLNMYPELIDKKPTNSHTEIFSHDHPEKAPDITNILPTNSNSTKYDKPLKVLLLSYQRSGSTIFSSLFGNDPNILFIYEPLDAIYTAMYGTTAALNTPADITITRKGDLRIMPVREIQNLASSMTHMFNCDFQNLPTEFFIHPFWYYFRNWTAMAKPYVSCLIASGIEHSPLSTLGSRLKRVCGSRFGDRVNLQSKCFGQMWPNRTSPILDKLPTFRKTPGLDQELEKYRNSLKGVSTKIHHCVTKYLQEPCESTNIRSIKTVRGTMDQAKILLEKHPDLKILHLLRDPRGVVRSRHVSKWPLGYFDSRDKSHTAHVYCVTAMADYRSYIELNDMYPNRVMHIVLENFLVNADENFKELQQFLEFEFREEVVSNMQKNIKRGFQDKWKTLKPEEIQKITKVCSEMMRTFNITV